MTNRSCREYAEVLRPPYQSADRRERRRILNEYYRTTGLHPKSAIRRLRGEAGGTLRCNDKKSELQAALGLVVLDDVEDEKACRMS